MKFLKSFLWLWQPFSALLLFDIIFFRDSFTLPSTESQTSYTDHVDCCETNGPFTFLRNQRPFYINWFYHFDQQVVVQIFGLLYRNIGNQQNIRNQILKSILKFLTNPYIESKVGTVWIFLSMQFWDHVVHYFVSYVFYREALVGWVVSWSKTVNYLCCVNIIII